MISTKKQNWTVGSTVKVGFLSLTVKACVATPGDYKPDAYILVNAAGTQLYSFVPHNGVTKISVEEAREMIETAKAAAAREAARAIAAAQKAAAIDEIFA